MAVKPIGLKLPKTGAPVSIPDTYSAGEWGEMAERLGYESIWTGESWGTHAFVDLAEILCRTSTLRVGTSVTNVYARTPADLAMGCGALSRISDGRFILGIGTSHAEKVRNIHGLEFDRPVRRVGETMELVQRLLGDERAVEYAGDVYELRGCRGLDEPVPVYNGALGELNLRVTGWFADGWIPNLLPLSAMESSFGTIANAARDVGRSPDDVSVSPQLFAAVSEDPEKTRDVICRYLGRSLSDKDEFRRVFEQRFPHEVERLVDEWESGTRAGITDCISDELLSEICVYGTPGMARTQLRAVLDRDVIDRLIVYVPYEADLEMTETTYEALSPELL